MVLVGSFFKKILETQKTQKQKFPPNNPTEKGK
jgi:hypothetical protein